MKNVSIFEGTPDKVGEELNSFFSYIGAHTLESVTQSTILKPETVKDYDAVLMDFEKEVPEKTVYKTHVVITLIYNT